MVRDTASAPTQNQALNALLFLYRGALGVELPWLEDLVPAKPFHDHGAGRVELPSAVARKDPDAAESLTIASQVPVR